MAASRTAQNLNADDYRRRYLGEAAVLGYTFYRLAVADVVGAHREAGHAAGPDPDPRA
jgi:hypothetical protein